MEPSRDTSAADRPSPMTAQSWIFGVALIISTFRGVLLHSTAELLVPLEADK
jgi:hypothetical protein